MEKMEKTTRKKSRWEPFREYATIATKRATRLWTAGPRKIICTKGQKFNGDLTTVESGATELLTVGLMKETRTRGQVAGEQGVAETTIGSGQE